MNRITLAFLTCFLSSLVFNANAAEPRQEPNEKERARTVYIFHQPIRFYLGPIHLRLKALVFSLV